ncbi:esterase/lipase family protein [Streptomyces sp. NPDC057798]|uniref:esterase/lipase family protein n=1 Tax=Streptomyces sp. NPDC057798 TaxID=3346252 RepID=UPI00369B2F78
MNRAPVHDLVVVLPGIMGTRLANADGGAVWDVSGGALWRALRTFSRSVKGLRLPPDIGDDHPGDGIRPVGVMPDLHVIPGIWHPVDGYDSLLRWLEQTFTLRSRQPSDPPGTPANLVEFGYDWRLSCRYNAQRLKERVTEELERWQSSAPERRDARVVFICHSMGGLVARFYVECLGGHEITRRLITLGTPHRGSLNALSHLVNGLRKGWGPFGANVTDLARSLPSMHQLLPDYACVSTPVGLTHLRDLTGLPGPDEKLLADAGRFHEELRRAAEAPDRDSRTDLVAVVGVRQPTATTAVYSRGLLIPSWEIDGVEEGGDGAVPRLSARPANAAGTGHLVGTSFSPSEHHGSLQHNEGVRDALSGWLEFERFHRGEDDKNTPRLSVLAPPLLAHGEPYEVSVTVPDEVRGHDELLVVAELRAAEGGSELSRSLRNLGGGRYRGVFPPPQGGAYRLAVWVEGRMESKVTALTLVGEPGE